MGIEDTHIRVPTELGDAGPWVRRTAASMAATLAELQRRFAPLAETWTGDAKIAFDAAEMEWHKASAYFFGDDGSGIGVLTDIAQHLDVAWINYVNGQVHTTKLWTG